MGFTNTLNHVTHGSLRLKIIDDHTRDSAVYSLIEMWDRYDPDTLMDLVDNDPDENRIMSKRFATAYAMKLLPLQSYKFNNTDIFNNAHIMYSFNTSKPTFLNTAKERR